MQIMNNPHNLIINFIFLINDLNPKNRKIFVTALYYISVITLLIFFFILANNFL